MTPRRTKAEPGTGVARLGELLDQAGMGGRGRRSPLARWLRAHHDEFAAMLADKDPTWDELAAALAAMGVLDGGGRPPTRERVRKAWWEARRVRLTGPAAPRSRPATSPRMAGEIAPAVHVTPEAGSAGGGAPTRLRMALDIRPAMPQDAARHGPGIATPPGSTGPSEAIPPDRAPDSGQPPPSGSAGEQLRRVLDQMNRRTVPLPRPVS